MYVERTNGVFRCCPINEFNDAHSIRLARKHFEDFDIVCKMKETLHQIIRPNRDVNEIETFLLDMQESGGNLYALFAAVNLARTLQIYFAISTLDDYNLVFNVINFCQAKNSAFY